jgi:type VI protein secretion system component VasF
MNAPDPVFARLAQLAVREPPAALASNLRARGHERLRARPLPTVWAITVVVAVVSYLGWALRFVSSLL